MSKRNRPRKGPPAGGYIESTPDDTEVVVEHPEEPEPEPEPEATPAEVLSEPPPDQNPEESGTEVLEAMEVEPKRCAFLVCDNGGLVQCGEPAVGSRIFRSLWAAGGIGPETEHQLCAEHFAFVTDALIPGLHCNGRYIPKEEAREMKRRFTEEDRAERKAKGNPKPAKREKMAEPARPTGPDVCPTCGRRNHPKAKGLGELLEVHDPQGVIASLPAETIREALRKLGLGGANLAVAMRSEAKRSAL